MTKLKLYIIFYFFLIMLLSPQLFAKDNKIITNAVIIENPPIWLKRTRVEKIIDRIQTRLEWSTRRISVLWFESTEAFNTAHSLGPFVRAVAVKGKNARILIGPGVTDSDFDVVFGHELVHIIIDQKYRSSIPKWLEEGLANHLARKKKVDYKWLSQQILTSDIQTLNHSYSGTQKSLLVQYASSQALAEMLDKKCGLENLIRLSVERKMESYIDTYCNIKDLNLQFRNWVKEKSSS